MSTSIIPVELDALPVPIRVVSEAQKHYLALKRLETDILEDYNARRLVDPALVDYGAVVAKVARLEKEQREWLRIIKELTFDTQVTFEQQTADILVQLAREDPELRKRLGEDVAREYQRSRGLVKEVVVDNAQP